MKNVNLSAKLQRNYRNKKGTLVFVYEVSGNEASIEAYKAAQGDNLREDEDTGAPLWFTSRCAGNRADLIITSKNQVIADMSQLEAAASLAAQFGGDFGQELAKAQVAQVLGTTTQAAATAPANKPETVEQAATDDIDQV